MTEKLTMRSQNHPEFRHKSQHGVSLIMVMLILIVVSVLGVGSAQIALMSERGARNDRDQQVAWQAAEAALNDADFDMFSTTSMRRTALAYSRSRHRAMLLRWCLTLPVTNQILRLNSYTE